MANFGATVAFAARNAPAGALCQAHLPRSLPMIVAGDRVRIAADGDGWKVTELLPRDSVLSRPDRRGQPRPLAANLTHLGVVAATPPGLDTLLIDQFCIAAADCGLDAMIIINKQDLLAPDERAAAEAIVAGYRAAGHEACLMHTQDDTGMAPLVALLPGKSFALVGASGAGKSSIVQQLLPDEAIRIGAVSAVTGLGAHTTSVTWWYPLGDGASIIDSPGVRQYSLAHLDHDVIRQGYRDIGRLAGDCRFANCRHLQEPGCAVRAAVGRGELAAWRYANYVKLLGSEGQPHDATGFPA